MRHLKVARPVTRLVLRFLLAGAPMLAALSMLSGCVSIPSPGGSGIVCEMHRPFIIASSKKSMGWGYYSHPYTFQYPDGTLLVRYFLHGDWKVNATAELLQDGTALARNPDGPWRIGREGLDELQRFGPYYMGGVLATSNEILFVEGHRVLRVERGTGRIVARHSVTFEVGKTDGMRLSKFGARARDGSLLFAAWRMLRPGEWETYLLRSTDGGHVFREDGIIASFESAQHWPDAPFGYEGPNEATLLQLPDGELLCVCRLGVRKDGQWTAHRGGRAMLMARSVDDGRTWKLSQMSEAGVCPKLIELQGGVLALAYGRKGNMVAFSRDRGHSWSGRTALSSVDARTSGYCDLVEFEPGRLLAVYDVYDTDLAGIWLWEPTEANAVYGRILDVRVP